MWKMKETSLLVVALYGAALFANPALAQDVYIYPNKGQSPEQQERDKWECNSWAVKQTGFNPMDAPRATTPPPPEEASRPGVLGGAARGAALGAVGGAIAGDAGKGAAIGAAAGGLFGGMRRRQQVREQEHQREQWAEQQAAQYQARRAEYNRAFGACLAGRGYTVK